MATLKPFLIFLLMIFDGGAFASSVTPEVSAIASIPSCGVSKSKNGKDGANVRIDPVSRYRYTG